MHALLLALALLLPTSAAAGQTAAEQAAEPAASFIPGLAVHLEETRLVAVSRSLEPVVLVLASPGRGTLAARTVQPGAILIAQHPPHALTGLLLEVLAAPGGRLVTSGALVLDGGAQTLHFGLPEATPATGRLALLAERALGRSPSFLSSLHGLVEPIPLHVPIPAPIDKPPGNTPPPVEKEPLPPV